VEYVSWFNHDRLHESLGDVPPVEFEDTHHSRSSTTPSGVVSDRRFRVGHTDQDHRLKDLLTLRGTRSGSVEAQPPTARVSRPAGQPPTYRGLRSRSRRPRRPRFETRPQRSPSR
jgi:hypothetical protein